MSIAITRNVYGRLSAISTVVATNMACRTAAKSARQYSPVITKNEPRIVPASFDFWVANLNRWGAVGDGISFFLGHRINSFGRRPILFLRRSRTM
jgi:hypothetical protein